MNNRLRCTITRRQRCFLNASIGGKWKQERRSAGLGFVRQRRPSRPRGFQHVSNCNHPPGEEEPIDPALCNEQLEIASVSERLRQTPARKPHPDDPPAASRCSEDNGSAPQTVLRREGTPCGQGSQRLKLPPLGRRLQLKMSSAQPGEGGCLFEESEGRGRTVRSDRPAACSAVTMGHQGQERKCFREVARGPAGCREDLCKVPLAVGWGRLAHQPTGDDLTACFLCIPSFLVSNVWIFPAELLFPGQAGTWGQTCPKFGATGPQWMWQSATQPHSPRGCLCCPHGLCHRPPLQPPLDPRIQPASSLAVQVWPGAPGEFDALPIDALPSLPALSRPGTSYYT